MIQILESLNNREAAMLVWLGLIVLGLLSRRDLRGSLRSVVVSVLQPAILILLSALAAWIGLELWVATRVGLWNTSLTKDVALWTAGSAGVLGFHAIQKASDTRFFRNTARGTLRVAVFVEFFLNLYVLSLVGELVLQLVVAVLSMMAAFTDFKPGYGSVKALCQGVLSLIVLALVGYTVGQMYLCWAHIDRSSLLLELVLPIWLTIGLLPFLWILSALVVYETAFVSVDREARDRGSRWRSRLALLWELRFKRQAIYQFRGYWARRLSEAASLRAAREVVAAFSEHLWWSEQAKADEEERLSRFAGSKGTDAGGRCLDRREFRATQHALRWIATCQMGWYRRRGGRYRSDILEVIDNNFPQGGLPKEANITLHIASDGQSWFAWRRTVTGWCFAIGAVGAPPNQWEYDGPEPPKGFPGEDPVWGDSPFSSSANRNWA